jgi:hypothetical protein
MVPVRFVILAALPLTPTGKVDRRALPAPGRARPDTGRVYAAPGTPLEKELAEIWAMTLDLDAVGVEDDFLDLGGDSLLATRIASRVRDTVGAGADLGTLLRAPTVASQARLILEHQLLALGAGESRELLDRLEAAASLDRSTADPGQDR